MNRIPDPFDCPAPNCRRPVATDPDGLSWTTCRIHAPSRFEWERALFWEASRSVEDIRREAEATWALLLSCIDRLADEVARINAPCHVTGDVSCGRCAADRMAR